MVEVVIQYKGKRFKVCKAQSLRVVGIGDSDSLRFPSPENKEAEVVVLGVSTLWGGGGSNIGQWGWVLLSECNPPRDPCVRLCLWQTIFFVSIRTALGFMD